MSSVVKNTDELINIASFFSCKGSGHVNIKVAVLEAGEISVHNYLSERDENQLGMAQSLRQNISKSATLVWSVCADVERNNRTTSVVEILEDTNAASDEKCQNASCIFIRFLHYLRSFRVPMLTPVFNYLLELNHEAMGEVTWPDEAYLLINHKYLMHGIL